MRFSAIFQKAFLSRAPARPAEPAPEGPQPAAASPAPEPPEDLDARVRLVGEWQVSEL